MRTKKVSIEIPAAVIANWQEITNILAEILMIPAALIMRFTPKYIDVFVSIKKEGNPYKT